MLAGHSDRPTLSGHLDFIKNFCNDLISSDVVGFSLVCDTDTVTENIMADSNNIFRDHEASLMEECIGSCRTCKTDGCTR